MNERLNDNGLKHTTLPNACGHLRAQKSQFSKSSVKTKAMLGSSTAVRIPFDEGPSFPLSFLEASQLRGLEQVPCGTANFPKNDSS